MPNIMNDTLAKQILGRDKSQDDANIFQGNTQSPFQIQKVIIALDNGNDKSGAGSFGNPFKISFPFRSIFVAAATDSNTTINLAPDTQDSFQTGAPLKINDSLDLDSPASSAYLTWPAQAGKTITLIFFVKAQFQSGSQLSLTGGGVSISEGSAFATSQVTLTAATPTSIFASNASRKISTFQNNTGASVWVGTSVVSNTGTNIGQEVLAGASFQWRNSAQLYGYSVSGGTIALLEET